MWFTIYLFVKLKKRVPVKIFLPISFIFVFLGSFAQSSVESWNRNYYECSVDSILKSEVAYSDSVISGLIRSRFYTRMDSYRFKAIYLGSCRKIEKSTVDDLKVVYRLNGGSHSQMAVLEQIKHEYLFNIEGKDLWLPMQYQLEKSFNHEIKAKSFVYLYCLFFNLYISQTGLGNWFLVSEFHNGPTW